MNFMFYGCFNLQSLDLSSFNTESVTTMDQMFFDCFNLEFIDLHNFDTKSVTSMSQMSKLSKIKFIRSKSL